MRDFLEDAHKHQDHGYGRHQQLLKPELPKRFYKETGTAPVEGGYAVTLDGRHTRTPGDKVPVVVPTLTLAESLAAEWAAQGKEINAETMPMVRLVNSALEGGQEAMGPLRRGNPEICQLPICCFIAPIRRTSWSRSRKSNGMRRWWRWRGISASIPPDGRHHVRGTAGRDDRQARHRP